MSKEYDVVLSFAGEDRQYAKELADLLKKGKYSVFYDEYEPAKLWGRNLYDYFSSIYKDQARYCVMFLSENYIRKLWTNHERQNAQARAFEENKEYILPVRLDDTEIPGILQTVGYLDLRSMKIEEIYQALVYKLSGDTPNVTPSDISTSTEAESDLGEFVLLRSEDGKSYFIPVQNAHWSPTEINLDLLPESSEETAFLHSLRNSISSQFAQGKILAFAHKEDAAWVRPQDVTQTTSGSQTIWKVVLTEGNKEQSFNPFGFDNMTVNNISSDQIAEMRVRRILLDERIFQNQSGFTGITDNSLLESFISSGGSTHEPRIQIQKSPIPEIYRSFGQTVERFKKFARLTSILYLKLSNTAEDILKLDLELLEPNQLQVNFKGRRRQIYTNVESPIIEVDGICPLSE